jgi:hypothetical protein
VTALAWGLLGLSGLVVLGNLASIVGAVLTRKRTGTSFVLFIGGLSGMVGCALLPTARWELGGIALALDPGSWTLVVLGLASLRSKREALGPVVGEQPIAGGHLRAAQDAHRDREPRGVAGTERGDGEAAGGGLDEREPG